MIRGKFIVKEIHQFSYSEGQQFILSAICDDSIPENQVYSKYTPSGQLTVQIANPLAAAQLKLGACYYLDLTPTD